MLSKIEELAYETLDEQELELAQHINMLLCDSKFDVASLIEDIIPVYWVERENGRYTLEPDPIYRPLMYLHRYADCMTLLNITRGYIINICAHLEGCLVWLTTSPPRFRSPPKPFGPLIVSLEREGVIPHDLADHLMKFNKIVNVPAKHRAAYYKPSSELDERTFSILDASLAFVMMRKRSIQLFDLLKKKGVYLPSGWKNYTEEWLSWNRLIDN